MADKIDLYKLHKDEYKAAAKPGIVEISPARYLSIIGQGDPNGEIFQTKTSALYGLAFNIKMNYKKTGQDYAVCKLEGLWWGSAPDQFDKDDRDSWNWKLLIRTPDFITDEHLKQAVETLLAKGKEQEVKEVRLETLDEGTCVQILHVGPYDQEEENIKWMHKFASDEGYSLHGYHHEIYLSDPRRVEPEKLKTILRHPVKR